MLQPLRLIFNKFLTASGRTIIAQQKPFWLSYPAIWAHIKAAAITQGHQEKPKTALYLMVHESRTQKTPFKLKSSRNGYAVGPLYHEVGHLASLLSKSQCGHNGRLKKGFNVHM